MKWEDCRGKYKAFISLGTTCQTAHQLKRLKLRNSSGPLDWFMSPFAEDVAKLLDSRFKGFMEWNNLQLMGTAQNYYIVRDTAYQIESYHDFPMTYNPVSWGTPYPQFKDTMQRRIKRFVSLVQKNAPLCFVRIQTSKAEAEQLDAALCRLARRPYRLLIVNLHHQQNRNITFEDWGLKRVASVSIPHGVDWKGSDEAWSTIMRGFSLSS
ncbi:DUF1796 family putative cysteine peptidase [Paenibacillus turpanensis]|uniref:DUF1796 family putative cysteine peptidase n=1 Tax=Paenibacillus turpanensis TaxID=2689078 RepID=UPI00140A8507|nr:DUF1796 family putative cysteine peptidase [Paenibacillus turpanensis]